jgi:hypothetical protein
MSTGSIALSSRVLAKGLKVPSRREALLSALPYALVLLVVNWGAGGLFAGLVIRSTGVQGGLSADMLGIVIGAVIASIPFMWAFRQAAVLLPPAAEPPEWHFSPFPTSVVLQTFVGNQLPSMALFGLVYAFPHVWYCLAHFSTMPPSDWVHMTASATSASWLFALRLPLTLLFACSAVVAIGNRFTVLALPLVLAVSASSITSWIWKSGFGGGTTFYGSDDDVMACLAVLAIITIGVLGMSLWSASRGWAASLTIPSLILVLVPIALLVSVSSPEIYLPDLFTPELFAYGTWLYAGIFAVSNWPDDLLVYGWSAANIVAVVALAATYIWWRTAIACMDGMRRGRSEGPRTSSVAEAEG